MKKQEAWENLQKELERKEEELKEAYKTYREALLREAEYVEEKLSLGFKTIILDEDSINYQVNRISKIKIEKESLKEQIYLIEKLED